MRSQIRWNENKFHSSDWSARVTTKYEWKNIQGESHGPTIRKKETFLAVKVDKTSRNTSNNSLRHNRCVRGNMHIKKAVRGLQVCSEDFRVEAEVSTNISSEIRRCKFGPWEQKLPFYWVSILAKIVFPEIWDGREPNVFRKKIHWTTQLIYNPSIKAPRNIITITNIILKS